MSRSSRMILSASLVLLLLMPIARAQDDKVVKAITPEAAEKLLQEMKIEAKKSSSKKGDEHYFDFTQNKYKIRLTQYAPDELMLDCVFRGIALEKVNQWNTLTRVTRASYHKDKSGEFTILEYGLDLAGGVSAGAIKQMITRFDDELKKFEKFVGANVAEDVVLTEVTNEKIENILKTQAITYQKKTNNAGVMMFDFEMNGYKLRLYNFGGKDLMIDAHFRKIPLEDANKYNLNRKFVRVVNYKSKDVEYTALEANLDCEAGATEGMVRHWISSFGEDTRHFSDYTKKLAPSEKK
jgi:hypothetical protein